MVTQNKVTVLLTASDESDCLNGEVMGYLRNGRLLVEDSPSVLLQSFNVLTISKLLYCVSIADHHIFSAEKRYTSSTDSLGSIVSGGFTVTQNMFTVIDELEPEIILPKPILVKDNQRKYSLMAVLYQWCHKRKIARLRQSSKFEQIWTMTRWATLAILRSYVVQLAYVLLPILFITFYYYSVKDFVRIDLGIGTHCK